MGSRFVKSRELLKSFAWILKISYQISHVKFIVRLVVTVAYALLPILSFWILKIIIDAALTPSTNPPVQPVLYLILFKVLIDMVWYFLDSFLEGLFKIMRFDLEAYFVNAVINKLHHLDLSFFENSDFLDIKQKALDTYSWRPTEFLNIVFWGIYNLVQVIIQSYILIRINPLWLIALFLFQIPSLMILVKIGQSAWNIWEADSTTRRKFLYFSGLFENISYIKEFNLFGVGDYLRGKINTFLREFHRNQKRIEHTRIIKGFGGVLLSNIPVFFISTNLLILLVKKEITPGLLTFYLSNLSIFSLALQNLVKNINFGFEVNLYIKEIHRFLLFKDTVSDHPIKEKNMINTSNLNILFNNVSFAYPGSKHNVLSDFSLQIENGKKIALVGENGSGKTTLIKLLCRFYDVQMGSITINGINIKDIPVPVLRSFFSVLFQDYVGYDLAVDENIAMGNIDRLKDMRSIIAAAQMSGADDFIKKLPAKYKQLLGNSFAQGVQLSIGQWQRIALAKAFMRRSPVVILDEPTSAVDAKWENEIFNKVMRLIKNKSVIIVSHRFSTVRHADEIVVINEGKICEKGSHVELMKQNGQYAAMFNLQAKAYR